MSKKKTKKQSIVEQVKEPVFTYHSDGSNKVMHFFSSLEDMEADNYQWLATLTPEQHLKNATALIKRIFADDLKKNPTIGIQLSFD
ncbi:MAG: hypothetical protein NT126_04290 [Bacteroidetes bacterium]|nr:hypothetical protein [Bacteroidota bacterium]